MNNDLTSKSLTGNIKLILIISASIMLLYSLAGIFVCNVSDDPFVIVIFFVIGNGVVILMALPNIIYCALKYKRFKKTLKSSDVFYGNLDEVQNTILIWRPFLLGCRVTINGHDTLYIYSYKSVIKLVNKKVAYIFDGDVAYLLRPAEH